MRPKWGEFKDSSFAEVWFYDQGSIFNAKEWLAKINEKIKVWAMEKPSSWTAGCFHPRVSFLIKGTCGDTCSWWKADPSFHHSLTHVKPAPSQAGFTLGSSSTRPHFQCWWRKTFRMGRHHSHLTIGGCGAIKPPDKTNTLTLTPISRGRAPRCHPEHDQRGTEKALFPFTKFP